MQASAPPPPPSPRTSKPPPSPRASKLRQLWDSVQVELHGDYPIGHIREFREYASSTSSFRALAVCVLTALPGVLMVLLIESIPLEDPATHTARQSPFVWLRSLVMILLGSFCVLEQFRQHVPSLELSRRQMVSIALPCSTVTALGGFVLADQIAYPMPFMSNIIMGPWVFALVGHLLFLVRDQLRSKPELIAELKRHQIVCICQFTLAVIYPIYNTVFVRLSAWEQTAFVFVLPCIKIAGKSGISRWLANTDEARSEGVVFNVEVFHALFVAFSMQGSSGVHTVAALMVVDFLQAWLSFRDVGEIVRQLLPLVDDPGKDGHRDIVQLADRIAELEPCHAKRLRRRSSVATIVASMRSRCWRPRVHALPSAPTIESLLHVGPVEPAKCDDQRRVSTVESRSTIAPMRNLLSVASLPAELQTLNPQERGLLVRQTQRLLFASEFIALVEYTEVIIPFIFNMYLFIMFHLSNRKYYAFLAVLTPVKLNSQMLSISVYALLELTSIIVMAVIMRRKVGLSLLHQIAFVLEKRQASIQSKIIMWSILVMNYGVQQYGVDYTFKFAWLHERVSLHGL